MRTISTTFFSALALTTALTAQDPTRTLPKAAFQTWGNVTYNTDASVTQFTLQNWYSAEHLPIGTVINAITFRGHPTLASDPYTSNLEITIENSSLGFGALSTQLANNLSPSAVVAFTRKSVATPALPPSTSPNDARNFWFVLDTPFVFTGPNLIIQIDEAQRVSTGWQSRQGLDMPGLAVHRQVDHTSCGGNLQAQYDGASYDLTVTGAPANLPVWFMFGVDTAASANPLPMDLASMGMPGCALGLDPFTLVAQPANASGTASMQVPFALPTHSAMISAQALHFDLNSSATFATTNTRSSVLGQLSSWSQVPSFNGVSALAGYPKAFNSGATLLIR